MSRKFILAALSTFFVVSLVDFVWHNVLLGAFYTAALIGGARSDHGALAPLAPFLVASDAVLALALVQAGFGFLKGGGSAVFRSGLLGGLIMAHFALVNYALLPTFPLSILAADSAFGWVAGALAGVVATFFRPEAGA